MANSQRNLAPPDAAAASVPASSPPLTPMPTILQQHDAALEARITALTTALSSNASAQHVAEVAIRSQHVPASGKPSELVSHAIQFALIDTLKPILASPDGRAAMLTAAFTLVDASILLLRDAHVPPALPLVLLEHMFSFLPQSDLGARVTDIRARFEAYRQHKNPTPALSDLQTIKAVMAVISRDQGGANPTLSGRLRLMLAAALPVWHTSGMNKRAQYGAQQIVDVEEMLRDAAPDVDRALYRAFWAAQEKLSCAQKGERHAGWKETASALDRVLSAFEAAPPDAAPDQPAAAPTISHSTHKRPSQFLSAPALLRLQLGDVRVRRDVLIQAAIMLHHLECVAPGAGDPSASTSEFCASLFAFGGAGERLRRRVYDMLGRECGDGVRAFVTAALGRERRWMEWKKRGYKHLDCERGPPALEFKRRRKLQSVVDDGAAPTQRTTRGPAVRMPAAWEERQKGWYVPPVAQRRDAVFERGCKRTWDTADLRAELAMDVEDEDITDDLKRKNDSKFVWRSLRMLSECDVGAMLRLEDGECGVVDLDELLEPEAAAGKDDADKADAENDAACKKDAEMDDVGKDKVDKRGDEGASAKGAADKDAVDKDATGKDATGKDATGNDMSDKDAANKGATDKDAAEKDMTDKVAMEKGDVKEEASKAVVKEEAAVASPAGAS